MTLDGCIEQYGVLPNEIGYSILKDVAYALSYLHQYNPAIIHRDLTATNVLLTRGMTAKISDLGMAKLLLSASHNKKMTETPGNPHYMPPETMQTNPQYGSKVDVFSFGVLMVYLFSGELPVPTAATVVDPQDESRMIPKSEADRRQEKLNAIGEDHPLMNLILRCLHNSPACRPEAVEILTQVSRVAAQFPPSSQNKLELLRQVNSLGANTQRLQQEHEAEITSMRAYAERLLQKHKVETGSLKADKKGLQQVNSLLIADAERLRQEHEVAITSMRADAERLRLEHQTEIRSLRESFLAEHECRDNEVAKLAGQNTELRQEMVEMEKEFERLLLAKDEQLFEKQQCLLAKEQQLFEKQKDLDQKSSEAELLSSKDSIIGGLQEKLDHLRKSHTAQVSYRGLAG